MATTASSTWDISVKVRADSLVAEIQIALREQGALIDGDDLPDPVALQYS
jgi:hypothetical protein